MTAAAHTSSKLHLRHEVGTTITPGDRLGNILVARKKLTILPGKGTYIRQGHLYASILGTLCAHQVDVATSAGNGDDEGERWVVSIMPEKQASSSLAQS